MERRGFFQTVAGAVAGVAAACVPKSLWGSQAESPGVLFSGELRSFEPSVLKTIEVASTSFRPLNIVDYSNVHVGWGVRECLCDVDEAAERVRSVDIESLLELRPVTASVPLELWHVRNTIRVDLLLQGEIAPFEGEFRKAVIEQTELTYRIAQERNDAILGQLGVEFGSVE